MTVSPWNFLRRPRRRDSLLLAPWATALVILPIAVLAIGTYFNTAFLWHEQVSPGALPDLTPCLSHRHEAIGRARLLASFLPYALVSVLIFLYFAREYIWFFGPQVRRRLAVPIILFLVPAVWIFVSQVLGSRDPLASLGTGYYEAVFTRLASCGEGAASMLFAAGDGLRPLDILKILTIAFSLLLTLAAGSVIVGTISTLATPRISLPARVRAYYRAIQRERLDRYLYASALLLVFGLFVMDSALRWPAAFSEDRALYLQQVNELMLYNGIFYSTILVAYYVPVALWHRGRYTRRPASAQAAAEGPDAPREETSLAGRLSPSRLIKTILALLSPAIAGVLTQLLEGFGS
jgi:hypothetical protein